MLAPSSEESKNVSIDDDYFISAMGVGSMDANCKSLEADLIRQ